MNEVSNLKRAALSGVDAEFISEGIQFVGVRGWALAKEVILNVQEVKCILQRQTAALSVLPIQESGAFGAMLDVPRSEVAVDPVSGQRMRIA